MNCIYSWFADNWIEVSGALLTLVFLYLEVTRKWTMWIVGMFSGLFYVYINFHEQLYAMSGLRTYDVAVSIYGIYCWRFAKTKNNEDIPFSFITRKLTLRLLAIGLLVFTAISFIVMRFSDIPNPLLQKETLFPFIFDTLIATLSILAAWMAARKIVESWYVWMFVNPCTIALYLYKGMYPSTILYLVYAIFSVVGYLQWRKIALK
jgi:nicotinamide mononucleotide transporter